MADPIFPNSSEVPKDQIYVPGSKVFTTLPIRCNKRNDIADAAAMAVVRDWIATVQDGMEQWCHGTFSPLGNFNSYIFPECMPERMAVIAWTNQLAFIHDDITEAMGLKEARLEHDALDLALDPRQDSDSACATATMLDSRTNKLVTLSSRYVLDTFELANLGHRETVELLDIFRASWLRVMEHDDTDRIQSLAELLQFRRSNVGLESFWNMVWLGMDMRLSASDEAMIADAKRTAEDAYLLTNDYFSWHRELEQSKSTHKGRIINAVWFIINNERVDEAEALQRVKGMVLDCEAEYLFEKAKVLENPNVPPQVRRWLEVTAASIGSYHYWAANAPNYHDWTTSTRLPPPDQPDLSQLFCLSMDQPLPKGSDGPTDVSAARRCSTDGSESAETAAIITPDDSFNGGKTAMAQAFSPAAIVDVFENDSHNMVTAPSEYIASLPSKGVRSMLFHAVNMWLDIPSGTLKTITAVVNDLHTSSLILDDIQDNSPLRRGHPAAHKVFGTAQSINSATYLYVKATAKIHNLGNPQMMAVFLEELHSLFVGQGIDLDWSFSTQVPTIDEYLDMVSKKTGGFMRMIARLCLLAAPHPEDVTEDFRAALEELAETLGKFFQIRDDYMNLASADYSDQKGFAEDLDEGKFSYPLLLALSEGNPKPVKDRLLGILRESRGSAKTLEAKKYMIALMDKVGAIEQTRKLLIDMEREIKVMIAGLEEMSGVKNSLMRVLLLSLSIADSAEACKR